jgi:hypothetical protein
MNKFKIMGLMTACLLVVMFSCKKKSNDETSTTPPATPTVNAKWIVGGIEAAQFTSFEFNKSGQFIVVMPTGLSYGNYTSSGVSMVLDNFGELSVTKLTNTEFGFVLTMPKKSGKATYTINSTRSNEVPATGNTALLCRTWNLDSMDHSPVAGTTMEIQMVFTTAGTYFVHYVYDNTNANALWKWLDSQQDTLCYSWSGTISCNGAQECKIDKLTSTKLVMSEIAYELEYVLTPYTAKSSIPVGPVRVPKAESNLLGK